MNNPVRSVCVFAPNLHLSVTVESGHLQGHDDLHIHPGGQGFWVARLLKRLGEEPVLVGLLGGEIGGVLGSLVPRWGVHMAPVRTEANSAGFVFDRRSGSRIQVAGSPAAGLDRHELDELYGTTLEKAAEARLCVITGRLGDEDVPDDLYRRLAADLLATKVPVIADLHGDELAGFLAGGPVEVLKVSDEDLVRDDLLPQSSTIGQRIQAARDLQHLGARSVVVSASKGRTIGVFGDAILEARAPQLQAVDHRGSGDSMTAGLTAAFRRGLSPADTLRLACAAGAANVTRHGLATASRELIEQLSGQVSVQGVERSELGG